MTLASVVRRLSPALLAFALAVSAARAQAPAPQKETFKPQVGQAGKDVIWVPTPDALVERMLDLGKVTAQDVVLDLGSGDGRTVIAAARRGARATGVEYNPDMVELSKQNAVAAGVVDRVAFVTADLFETDLSKATVITMFLLPDINLRLRPKLLELRPGTRIVSNSFTMGDWHEDDISTIDDCASWCTARLWIVPAKAAGTWRLANGELTLQQEFQMLSGTLAARGQAAPITEGRMRGDQIDFVAGSDHYVGRVQGTAITGTVTSAAPGGARGAAAGRAWSATRVQ